MGSHRLLAARVQRPGVGARVGPARGRGTSESRWTSFGQECMGAVGFGLRSRILALDEYRQGH